MNFISLRNLLGPFRMVTCSEKRGGCCNIPGGQGDVDEVLARQVDWCAGKCAMQLAERHSRPCIATAESTNIVYRPLLIGL